MTENEKKEMNNPTLHILTFVWLRIKLDIISPIISIPREIKQWLYEQGWKLVFKFMDSSMKKSLENLKNVKKYFEFRNWMIHKMINYMTVDQKWILAITHPIEEGQENNWIQLAFLNPHQVTVGLTPRENGNLEITSMRLLPPPESVLTDYHIVNEEHLEYIINLQERREMQEAEE